MKTPISIIRLVCQLLNDPNQSFRAIAKICKVSHNTIKRIATIKAATQLSDVQDIGDDALTKLFYKQPASSKLDSTHWHEVHSEIQQRDLTKQLLWQEYREKQPAGLSYSQFCKKYCRWLKTSKISLRQTHRPGEHLFIDFCGRTMPIRDKVTGEEWRAQVFVGALGASGYIYATAIGSQTIADFLDAHVKMFEHIKGVPKYVVPDNLKSAVIKNTREVTQLNEAYSELSDHYDFIILPARPRKPKDKPMAEVSVQIVQRFVLARLRHRVFFSLKELNREIEHWMKVLNERMTRTYTVCRSQRLETIDRPFLSDLPTTPYGYSSWQFRQRVDESYHVSYQGKHYSVPYVYAHLLVDVRSTVNQIDIYCQRQRIASHVFDKHAVVITNPEHYPPHHAYAKSATPDMVLAWAERMGSATKQFIETNLKDRRYFATRLKAANQLRSDVLNKKWESRLEDACQHAIRINGLTFQTLYSILKHETYKTSATHVTPVITHDNLRGAAHYAKVKSQTSLKQGKA